MRKFSVPDKNSRTRILSFPSSFDKGGNFLHVPGLTLKNAKQYQKDYNENYVKVEKKFSSQLAKINSKNFGGIGSSETITSLLQNDVYVDISKNTDMYYTHHLSMYNTLIEKDKTNAQRQTPNFIGYENPYHFASDALHVMNTYKYKNKYKTLVPLEAGVVKGMPENGSADTNSNTSSTGGNGQKQTEPKSQTVQTYMKLDTTLSMFNPNNNVQIIGMANNTPLLIDATASKYGTHNLNDTMNSASTLSDCTIRTLVTLSQKGRLGSAIYRFSDFMYCEELGTVSNNYLITLRKFNLPVGDHISFAATPKHRKRKDSDRSYDPGPEAGHLVTWFGTTNNKLEDILSYSYQYTWKQLQSEIQQLDSQEDDASRGIIGMLGNTMSGSYNNLLDRGLTGGHDIITSMYNRLLGGKNILGFTMPQSTPDASQKDRLRNYDQNKVYEKKQTIRDMHIPDGALKFSHEFQLVFSYKLRAYENINPKSAFLDLLHNILHVTYFNGQFWGGEQKIVGPRPNNSAYRTAYRMIDNAFDSIGNFFGALFMGDFDVDVIKGWFGNLMTAAGEAVQWIKDQAEAAMTGKSTIPEKFQGIMQWVGGTLVGGFKTIDSKFHITRGMKGALKNALGRPAFYAFNSLLSGEDTGLWHVTIGNPRNPIVSFGNLIMTDASVTHSGPLGLDDFPTNIKVTVKLKHARSRDAAAIGKMYTGGLHPLSYSQQHQDYSETRLEDSGFEMETTAKIGDKEQRIRYGEAPHVTLPPKNGSGLLKNEAPPPTPNEGDGDSNKEKTENKTNDKSTAQNKSRSTPQQKDGSSGGDKQTTNDKKNETGTGTGTNGIAGQTNINDANTQKIDVSGSLSELDKFATREDWEAAQTFDTELTKLMEDRLTNMEGMYTKLEEVDGWTYTIDSGYEAMMFHNGNDNIVAIMTANDQES